MLLQKCTVVKGHGFPSRPEALQLGLCHSLLRHKDFCLGFFQTCVLCMPPCDNQDWNIIRLSSLLYYCERTGQDWEHITCVETKDWATGGGRGERNRKGIILFDLFPWSIWLWFSSTHNLEQWSRKRRERTPERKRERTAVVEKKWVN